MVPGYDVTTWYGFFAPRGTPPAVIAKLNKTLNEIIAEETVRERLTTAGVVVQGSTPDEFGRHLEAEFGALEQGARGRRHSAELIDPPAGGVDAISPRARPFRPRIPTRHGYRSIRLRAAVATPGLPPPATRWTGFPRYNFTGGHNDAEQVPVARLVAAAAAVLERGGSTLATYGLQSGPQGHRRLREFLAAKLSRSAGISCTADGILITSGSLQAIDLVNGVLLSHGDTVLVEQETYQGSLTRLVRLGVDAVGIPLDDGGMRMDALAAALAGLRRRGIRPKYIYTIPTVHNPTGTVMGQERRCELLRLAHDHGVPVLEDECYSDLVWSGERPPAIHAMSRQGGVIHIGSFSKSIAPALRVGYVVAGWDVLSRMLAIKTDAGSGALEQRCWPSFVSRASRSMCAR